MATMNYTNPGRKEHAEIRASPIGEENARNVPTIARIVPNSPRNTCFSGFSHEERAREMAYGKGYGGMKKGGSKSGSGGKGKGNIVLSPSGKQSKPAPCGPHTPRK